MKGTLTAGEATVSNLATEFVYAKFAPYGESGGWINLHDEGITVYLAKDGRNGLGSVTARAYNQ
ncbi:hypothetical protein [Streptosporangium roseum]|uniref:hypothetical protein n=1 Tax=Streptosporangium roseum TaxID=2001 RepID=UPI00331B85F3